MLPCDCFRENGFGFLSVWLTAVVSVFMRSILGSWVRVYPMSNCCLLLRVWLNASFVEFWLPFKRISSTSLVAISLTFADAFTSRATSFTTASRSWLSSPLSPRLSNSFASMTWERFYSRSLFLVKLYYNLRLLISDKCYSVNSLLISKLDGICFVPLSTL